MLTDLCGSRVPTTMEFDIIRLVSEGLKNKDVALVVGLTEHVVKSSLRIIYDKLGMWNRLELSLWYVSRQVSLPAL
jgi:DNA-binding NarL/FixJ family response regulator